MLAVSPQVTDVVGSRPGNNVVIALIGGHVIEVSMDRDGVAKLRELLTHKIPEATLTIGDPDRPHTVLVVSAIAAVEVRWMFPHEGR